MVEMRSLKVILALVLSVCLWSETSAACAMKWEFLEENYNPSYQDDERDNALCAGKPDGFYANVGQCVPDFYGCVGGAYFALTCESNFGPGYVFDPSSCSCVPYQSSSCQSTTPTMTTVTTRNPLGCSDRDDGSYQIGSSCGPNYFMCIDGTFYPQNCPGTGNVFDPVVSACVSYNRASCKTTFAPGVTSTASTMTDSSIASSGSTEALPDTPNTLATDSSTSESASPSTTSTDSSTIAPSTDSTIVGSTTTISTYCPTSSVFTCPTPFGNFAIQDGKCCKNYYQCITNNPVVTNCPNAFIFNPDIKYCDYDYNVATCPSFSTSSSPSVTDTSTTSFSTDSTTTEPTTESTTSSTDLSTKSTPVPENRCDNPLPFICPVEYGNFPVVVSTCCKNYYQCVGIGEEAYNMTCPGTTVFNPDKNTCDSTHNVIVCGGSITPSTTVLAPFVCPSPGTFSIPGECSARYYSCNAAGGEPQIDLCPNTNFVRYFDCTSTPPGCRNATLVPCNIDPAFPGCPVGTKVSLGQVYKELPLPRTLQSIWNSFVKWAMD